MDWYRIKTVLIWLFLAINIFLIAMLSIESFSEARTANAEVDAAVKAVSAAGMELRTEIPKKRPRLSALSVTNLAADRKSFSEKLLGGKATRVGDVYRREGAEVSFSAAGFIYKSTLPAAENVNIRDVRKRLSDMGLSMTYARAEAADGVIRFSACVHGQPVYGCAITVTPAADGISRMEGSWLDITEVWGDRRRIRSAANALVAFLQTEDRDSTITAVMPGYAVLWEEGGYKTADAVPVWCITDGSGKGHFYDAR